MIRKIMGLEGDQALKHYDLRSAAGYRMNILQLSPVSPFKFLYPFSDSNIGDPHKVALRQSDGCIE